LPIAFIITFDSIIPEAIHTHQRGGRHIEGVAFSAFHSAIRDGGDFFSRIGRGRQRIDDAFLCEVFTAIVNGAHTLDGHAKSSAFLPTHIA